MILLPLLLAASAHAANEGVRPPSLPAPAVSAAPKAAAPAVTAPPAPLQAVAATAAAASAAPLDYRGVPQAALISSLAGAVESMTQARLGPATAEMFEKWRQRQPLEAIARANDNKELAAAMRQNGLGLSRSYSFYQERALLDLKGRPEHAGALELYAGLDAWGAFSGAHTLEYRPTDGEKDAYRASILAREVRRRLLLPQTHARLFLAAFFMPQGFAERILAPWRLTRAVAASFFGREAVARYFMKLDIRDRHLLVDGLRFASGLDKLEKKLPSAGAMIRFGVAVPDLPRTFGEMEPILNPIREEAEKILLPYYETDEIQMSGIGGISWTVDKKGRIEAKDSGVMFGGSRRAAQALADAHPEWNVVDQDGKRLEPRR